MDATVSTRRALSGIARLLATLPLYAVGLALMLASIVAWAAFGTLVAIGFGLAVGNLLFQPSSWLAYGIGGLFGLVGAWVILDRVRSVFRNGLRVEPAAMIARTRRPYADDPRERSVPATVQRLCQGIGLSAPAVRIQESERPLCYSVRYPVETPPARLLSEATGPYADWAGATPAEGLFDETDAIPEDHVLVVSTGLIDALSDDELRAVLAHEVAHLRNDDLRLVNWLLLPVFWAEELADVDFSGELGDKVVDAVACATGLTTRFVTELGIGAFSRGREYAADRAAADLTGDPAALASALERLDDDVAGAPDADLRAVGVVNVLPTTEGRRRGILATHPPTEERIERLRSLVAAQET